MWLHPTGISRKVAIVAEHLRAFIAPLLDGHIEAMMPLESRKETVRWKLTIGIYIRLPTPFARTLTTSLVAGSGLRLPA